MAMRKPGVYVALSANYADDEKIMEAGEDAELMYVRMLAYAARTPLTEGWISDRVIQSRLGILPRVSGNGAGTEPGTDAGSRAERLREVGLIERDGDGYRIKSWLRWNKSAEEMGRERARDSNRKKHLTSENDGNDAGNDAGTGAGVPDPIRTADQNTDQKQISAPVKPSRKRPSTSLPDGWAPNDKHREEAHKLGIDLNHQADRFRNWALSKDTRYANWDAAFTNWIKNAKPTGKPTTAPKDQLPW